LNQRKTGDGLGLCPNDHNQEFVDMVVKVKYQLAFWTYSSPAGSIQMALYRVLPHLVVLSHPLMVE
jgi:hypothetical protein